LSSSAAAAAPQSAVVSPVVARSPISRPGRSAALCLVLALATIVFYSPVAHNGFTNFDDDAYIVHNPHVRAGLTWQTVKWAFTSYDAANWHPLTWMSHALDYELFKLNPAGHHYETALLHAANAALLFLLLETATGLAWPSLMVAALFALHPVNVESVAWAAERKNVLSMFFFLLTLHTYGWYVRRMSVGRYAGVAVLFALGLMAKPEIITLPFVLLLWDYWPLQRTSGAGPAENPPGAQQRKSFTLLLLEKIPLLLLSTASAVITVRAQVAGDTMPTLPIPWRLGNAIVAYVRYLGIAIWPAGLAVPYPHPGLSLAVWKIVASAALLLLLTTFVLRLRKRRYLAMGWFWFLGTLVPVIGIIQVGRQALADRYAYLSFIGLFICVVWGVAETARQWKINTAWLAASGIVILATLGMLTHRQIAYWHDSETLWRHSLSVTEGNSIAHDNLGRVLVGQGRTEAAIAEFKAADKLDLYTAADMLEIGLYEQVHGHLQDAIQQYGRSLDRAPDANSRAAALSLMGSAFALSGDFERAKLSYKYALQQNPDYGAALVGSGLLAERDGDFPLATAQLSHAMKVGPSDVGYLLLAQALRRAGRLAEANDADLRARQISHDLAQARQSAAQLLASTGIKPE
jgi:protein O-mannosyl-transferase